MHSVDVLEQGARSAIALSADFESFQWEKSGVAEGCREKNCYGPSKRTCYGIHNVCAVKTWPGWDVD